MIKFNYGDTYENSGLKSLTDVPKYEDYEVQDNSEFKLEPISSSTIIMNRIAFKELWDRANRSKPKTNRLVLHDD